MARRFPLLAVIFVLALALAACPEDIEEAVEDDQPTEPIEQVRDAASNTLGADTADITITLQADDTTAGADQDVMPTDDDDGLEDDDNGLDDDTATGQDDDVATTDDATADQDTLTLSGQEDFSADRRQLNTEGQDDHLELIVDGSDLYVLLNGDPVATGDETVPADDETPPTEEDDDNGLDDDTATDEDDDNGLDDDDAATDEDDDVATDDEDGTADEEWGWFDLNELWNGTNDEATTEDDEGTDATVTTTADDDLERFPFRDSHVVLQVLEDVEGDVSETQNGDDQGFTVYDVNVDVQETETTGDAQEWLDRVADGQDRFTITVWIDDEYVVQVEYDLGTETDADAPQDDVATDDDDDTVVTDDDDNGLDDDDAATTEDDDGLEGDDDTTNDEDNGLEDDDNGLDDDTATGQDDDDAATTDDDTAAADDDLTATTDEGALTVTIEYTNLGDDVEIELPDDDQVVDIDEQELRQLLPSLPGETDDPVDAAPTG